MDLVEEAPDEGCDFLAARRAANAEPLGPSVVAQQVKVLVEQSKLLTIKKGAHCLTGQLLQVLGDGNKDQVFNRMHSCRI